MSTTASARNIYFCGSIRAGRGDADLYGRIVKKLETHGKVLTPFVADPSLTATDSAEGGVLDDRGIHDRDVRLLTESQAVVAEVTIPSHGVGYEIGRAVDMKRKILCLYRPQEGKRLSAMINGIPAEVATVLEYKEEDLDEIFNKFFAST